jgi:hypothetical protein
VAHEERPRRVPRRRAVPVHRRGTHLAFRHSGLEGVAGWLMKKGMTRGWQRMVERSIPFVAAEMARGRTPTRDEVGRACRARG